MIHVIQKETSVEVWTDPDDHLCLGRRIGAGSGRQAALQDAYFELQSELEEVLKRSRAELVNPAKP